MDFTQSEFLAPRTIKNIKILWAVPQDFQLPWVPIIHMSLRTGHTLPRERMMVYLLSFFCWLQIM